MVIHSIGLKYSLRRDFHETAEEDAHLESQIDSIDVDFHCDRIHLRSSASIPLRKFDAFYLSQTKTNVKITHIIR